MAATGHGATFTFICDRGIFRGRVTNVSVESPSAELADMTGATDGVGYSFIVPTGSWKGGSVSVDFNAEVGVVAAETLVRGVGQLTFSSAGYSVQRQVVLESASSTVTVGDIVKGSLKFVLTDYYT